MAVDAAEVERLLDGLDVMEWWTTPPDAVDSPFHQLLQPLWHRDADLAHYLVTQAGAGNLPISDAVDFLVATIVVRFPGMFDPPPRGSVDTAQTFLLLHEALWNVERLPRSPHALAHPGLGALVRERVRNNWEVAVEFLPYVLDRYGVSDAVGLVDHWWRVPGATGPMLTALRELPALPLPFGADELQGFCAASDPVVRAAAVALLHRLPTPTRRGRR